MDSLVYSSYNMLPKFSKITSPVFLKTNYATRRKLSVYGKYDTIFEHDCSDDIKYYVTDYIVNNALPAYRGIFYLDLEKVGFHIYEDFAIHRVVGDKDWLCYAHVSFPNGWFPDKQIGKSYSELHSHIPGMNIKNSKKILDASINNGPYERYVWGIIYDYRMNGHPSIPIKKFDINNPEFYIRVETQFVIGFPKLDSLTLIKP